METKVCQKCKAEKDILLFSWRSKNKGTRQSYCKDCATKVRMEYYWLDPVSHREKADARRDIGFDFVYTLLAESAGCIDCGEKDLVCLDFDHISGTKISAISVMMNNGWALEKIKEEISKCVIRCANCHRKKTASQFGWYKQSFYARLTQRSECLSYKEEVRGSNP
jgi:protein-arginine kinase activator protein McsA